MRCLARAPFGHLFYFGTPICLFYIKFLLTAKPVTLIKNIFIFPHALYTTLTF